MRLDPHSPVLARPGPTGGLDVQIGLAHPVVLAGLGLDERAFVASLEGGRPVPSAQARRFTRVIAMLTDAGAWERRVERALPSVAVHGCGPVGMAVAAALAGAGYDVALEDTAPVGVEPVGTFARHAVGTCAGAAAATLSERGIATRLARGDEELAVIVCTGAPDPRTVMRLVLAEVPHVLVVCDGVGVWVSHVTVPGVTACARCRDLALTREDAAWPRLSLQLGGGQGATRRPVAPRLSLGMAAAHAAARIAQWAERGDAGIAARIAADGSTVAAPLAQEPACGCGASGPEGDEVAARRARWRD